MGEEMVGKYAFLGGISEPVYIRRYDAVQKMFSGVFFEDGVKIEITFPEADVEDFADEVFKDENGRA